MFDNDDFDRAQNTSPEHAQAPEDDGRYSFVPSQPVPPSPEIPPVKTNGKRHGFSTVGLIALILCCSLLGGAVGVVVTTAIRGSAATDPDPSSPASENGTVIQEGVHNTTPVTTTRVDTGEQLTAADVYAANVNSAVGITVSITTNSWGYQSTYPASGSGFVLTADGYILTNYHVIEDSSSISVTTYDNTIYDAEIVGYDASNDVAILKIDADDLTPVVLGSSDALRVGDPVITIGNPLGELTFSLTQGVISALNREVTVSSGVTMDLIQTDAAINSGNSGGPLFNLYGEVVGITNAKYSTQSGSGNASIDNIGFAIPIDQVRGIIKSIIENGYILKPYIGVTVGTVGSEMISYGFPQGAIVRSVTEGSPAEAAGLMINDIVTAVNGEEIISSSDLVRAVSRCEPGDAITLTVYRQGGTSVDLAITVGEQQLSAQAEEEKQAQEPQQQQQQGSMPFDPFEYFFGYGNVG